MKKKPPRFLITCTAVAALIVFGCWWNYFRTFEIYTIDEFSRTSWNKGPGWDRWRMREVTLHSVKTEWSNKEKILSNLGEPEIERSHSWLYELKWQHPTPIDSYWIDIRFDSNDIVENAVIRGD